MSQNADFLVHNVLNIAPKYKLGILKKNIKKYFWTFKIVKKVVNDPKMTKMTRMVISEMSFSPKKN